MSSLNRREFVVVAASAAACACAMCGGAEDALAAPRAGAKVDVGTLADYPADVVSDKFLKAPAKLLVVRSGERLYAMNGTCTHKSCLVKLKDGAIKCPCHGSQFSEHGTVTAGPAKASLFRYKIAQDEKGRLIVDKSKQFGERQWDDPASYVKVA
jgi:Rieske Fe-S protein